MKITKYLLLGFIGLLVSATAISQEIESSLTARFGSEEIQKIYNYRYTYYHFLVYEMNNGYKVVGKKQLTKDQKSSALSINEVKNLKNNDIFSLEKLESKTFYFLDYSFTRNLDSDVIYKLNKDEFMIIYSKQNIAKMYKSLHGEEKKTTPKSK